MLRRLILPTLLVAVLTGAMQAQDSKNTLDSLLHLDAWFQVFVHFAEVIGVLWVFLRYLVRPMLQEALRPMLQEALRPVQQEQAMMSDKVSATGRRLEELSNEFREHNDHVRQLSLDVGRVLGRTD